MTVVYPAHSLILCPPLMLYNTRPMLLTSETHQQQHNLRHLVYFAHRWNSTQLQLLTILLLKALSHMGPQHSRLPQNRKFTDAALKWYTYKKECYSEYASMKAYEDYIFGRWFYVYNDHQNLLQIAASTVPIIVRMLRLYMQSHVFFRKYIKGTDNWAADFMSRLYESHKLNVINTEQSTLALLTGDSI